MDPIVYVNQCLIGGVGVLASPEGKLTYYQSNTRIFPEASTNQLIHDSPFHGSFYDTTQNKLVQPEILQNFHTFAFV